MHEQEQFSELCLSVTFLKKADFIVDKSMEFMKIHDVSIEPQNIHVS